MKKTNDVKIVYSIPEFRDNAARLRNREEEYLDKAKNLERAINIRLKYWLLPYAVVPLVAAIVFSYGVNDDTLPRFGALLLILATAVTVWNFHLVQKCRDYFANKGCRYLDHRISNVTWYSIDNEGISEQVSDDMIAWHRARLDFDFISDNLELAEGQLLSRVLLVEGLFGLLGTILWGFGDWLV